MVEWVLVALGSVMAFWAFWRARGQQGAPRRRNADPQGQPQVQVPDPDDPLASAWAILGQPVQTQSSSAWEELAGRPALRQFRLGAAFGLGLGLILAGIVYAVLPARAPAPVQPPAARQPAPAAQPPAGGAARAPAATPPQAPPAAPKAAEPVSIVVAEGDLPNVVAAKLVAARVITSEQQFLNRLVERELDTRLRPGTFKIPAGAAIDAIIDTLTS